MLKMKEKQQERERESVVNLSTEKFGNLCIKKENIITFDAGILGFEDLKQFVIVDVEECLPFEWLISVKDPLIAFPILNPTPFFADYNPMKSITDLTFLTRGDKKDVEIFCTVTLGNSPSDVTINLKGPVFINMKDKKGKQFVLTEDYYSLHHPLLRA
ncbi:MAG: flagellar assembly protein FliW [Candidatus Brocadia sp.]|nr:MAG: flagellar assembly protein FliW [Candidatus Brocadia sp.]